MPDHHSGYSSTSSDLAYPPLDHGHGHGHHGQDARRRRSTRHSSRHNTSMIPQYPDSRPSKSRHAHHAGHDEHSHPRSMSRGHGRPTKPNSTHHHRVRTTQQHHHHHRSRAASRISVRSSGGSNNVSLSSNNNNNDNDKKRQTKDEREVQARNEKLDALFRGPPAATGIRGQHWLKSYGYLYYDFTTLYNSIDALMRATVWGVPGQMKTATGLITLGASGWLMYRNVLYKMWIMMKAGKTPWVTASACLGALVTTYIAVLRGQDDRRARMSAGLL